jgi:hypothetical protein
MSNYFNPDHKVAYDKIGGSGKSDYDNDYIKKQKKVLTSNPGLETESKKMSYSDVINYAVHGVNTSSFNTKKSANNYYEQYNPYHDFLAKKGIRDDSKIKIKSSYLSIDSSTRVLEPSIIYDTTVELDEDPLQYELIDINLGVNSTKQNTLIINYPNHNINKDDKIILGGLINDSFTIKNIFTLNNVSTQSIIFTPLSTSVAIICNYNFNESISFIPKFSVGAGISYTDLKNYDTTDMMVRISGFDISPLGTPYVGNIPINFLNGIHRIYFTNPDITQNELVNIPINTNVNKINGFYILLPKQYSGIQSVNIMNITLQFNNIGGIPINTLNAEYPIDNDHVNGYHIVNSITTNTISILLNKISYYKTTSIINGVVVEKQIPFGGKNIFIAKILEIRTGYSNPNYYKFTLPNIYHNVFQIKMIGSSFPNTMKIFDRENKLNTKLYWQNQDDGDIIYSINIPSGNYTLVDLQTIIQTSIYNVVRKYYSTDTQTNYNNKNYISISVEQSTNIVTFKSYKEAFLSRPIIYVEPTPPDSGEGVDLYKLTIKQLSHGLQVGDSVTFTGLITTFGISDTLLNTIHIITFVASVDTYIIELKNINLLNSVRTNTYGGYNAKAYVPNNFRLLFNYRDTFGKEFGFRNVGNSTSITKFNSVITNADAYENEFTIQDETDNTKFYILDQSGNKTLLINNSIKISGDDYVYMYIREFGNIINNFVNNGIMNFFSKINFNGLPGKIIYDSFINTVCILDQPIDLTELNITFFGQNGNLYDFGGIDHSFVLEIMSVEYSPTETEILSSHSPF